MFHQICLSSPVKRSATISNSYGIHELSHELLNELDLVSSEIRKGQKNLKTS